MCSANKEPTSVCFFYAEANINRLRCVISSHKQNGKIEQIDNFVCQKTVLKLLDGILTQLVLFRGIYGKKTVC